MPVCTFKFLSELKKLMHSMENRDSSQIQLFPDKYHIYAMQQSFLTGQ